MFCLRAIQDFGVVFCPAFLKFIFIGLSVLLTHLPGTNKLRRYQNTWKYDLLRII